MGQYYAHAPCAIASQTVQVLLQGVNVVVGTTTATASVAIHTAFNLFQVLQQAVHTVVHVTRRSTAAGDIRVVDTCLYFTTTTTTTLRTHTVDG